MKVAALLLILSCSSCSDAFSMGYHQHQRVSTTTLSATSRNSSDNWDLRQTLATAFVTATLWASPSLLPPLTTTTSVAQAKEMASGTGSRVNKDPESLLRYGLPINNKEVRKLQGVLEDVRTDIGTKRKSAAEGGVKKAKAILASKDSDKMIASCREAPVCQSYINDMQKELDPLRDALLDSMEAFQGSEQERKALDKAYAAQSKAMDLVGKLEEQMVPAGYKVPVPDSYRDLPQLQGRATVEFVLQKADKSTYDVEGTTFPQAKMTMVIDGYAAPVTAGNFVDLVSKGFYNKMTIQRSDGFVVQTGDPDGEADGYVGTPSQSVGKGPHGERLIPLEIFVRGDKAPFYETTIEDEGRGGQATLLPFNSYGAMGWARDEYDVNSGSSQFFWLLFDSDLTPAGKNVLDGRYPCFGYVTEGASFLGDVDEGDIIISTKITSGMENLIQPSG